MKRWVVLLMFVLSVVIFSVSAFACALHDEKIAAEKTAEKIS
jgi:hypothetical protein